MEENRSPPRTNTSPAFPRILSYLFRPSLFYKTQSNIYHWYFRIWNPERGFLFYLNTRFGLAAAVTNAFGSWKFNTVKTKWNISRKAIYDNHICATERKKCCGRNRREIERSGSVCFVVGLFSELCSLGLLKHIYIGTFFLCTVLTVMELEGSAVERGARQDDASFRHLSVPVILRHQIWSLELAKANYLGQTISISKYSQRIAFHYWHAGQAEKLLSTQRDRGKRNNRIRRQRARIPERLNHWCCKTRDLKQTHLCTFTQTA